MTMKKKILSAAVLAALGAGTAQAVNMGNDGTGQVLLFPYYTVQGGEETILSVVNTTDMGKTVKIRFREAYNSREVLDFNIFLSPWDVWTGKVQDDAGGGAAIQSYDATCTVPNSIASPGLDDDDKVIPGTAAAFRPYAYDGTAPNEFEDGGPQGDIGRTNEGYVEIIEMGVMYTSGDEESEWEDVWDNNKDGKADFVHEDGVPNNCAGISSNYGPNPSDDWNSGDVLNTKGLYPPTGGMFGSLAIINVQAGTEISVNATALEDVFHHVVHYSTGSTNPDFNDADGESAVLMNGEGGPNQDPYLVWEYWDHGVDAVSSVLMADAVMNEYTVNPNVAGETAWVVTFPTKWAYADRTWDADEEKYEDGLRPFTSNFNAPTEGEACEPVGFIAYDREELGREAQDVDFSPAPEAPGITLCYEVNVIQYAGSNVMSSENTTMPYGDLPGKNGWIKLDLSQNHSMMSTAKDRYGHEYVGLPVIGFTASTLGNAGVGVGAAYGTSNDHVYHRTIDCSGSCD